MFLEFLEIFAIALFAVAVIGGHIVAEVNSRKRTAQHEKEWAAYVADLRARGAL